jgi:hypothetical protein
MAACSSSAEFQRLSLKDWSWLTTVQNGCISIAEPSKLVRDDKPVPVPLAVAVVVAVETE